ncbi:mechanosensitive ion channel family protein [Halomonas daqiaonensis]|uniref:Small-conductance mechanosensitive channel n=1 Tax=Halomonas daqiaonensis TaxID=650850 RepID=A0A1H7RGV6_9GAMM|nr:mechanosensitive ion channel family protein [Halomonas daqiaonensis]SEL59412.1 Small-conductance mechanosensitive channel [Halomonas daqiaonensis]
MNPDRESSLAEAPAWLPPQLVGYWEFLIFHPFVLAALIVVLGIGLAVIGRALVMHWGDKLISRISRNLGSRLLRICANTAAWFLAYLALVLAVQVIGFTERAEQITIRVLTSLLVLRLVKEALSASHLGLEILSRVRDRYAIIEERTIPLFDLMFTVVIIGAAAYLLLQIWNIDPAAWLASAGVVGIAVGFAARDTLANLFAGFFIIADGPYKLGDYIVLDSGDRGEVTKVGIRSTRLLTRDDVEITVPNAEMANAKIYNESGGRWVKFRIRLEVGVAYGSDVDEVVELLEGIATEHDNVCNHPAPRVRMRGFGNSSLDFELLCWVNHPSQRGLVAHQLYMHIYKALGSAGIEIPFPQRDIWLRDSGKPSSEET